MRTEGQAQGFDRQLQSDRSASEDGAEYDARASPPFEQYSRSDTDNMGSLDVSSIHNGFGMSEKPMSLGDWGGNVTASANAVQAGTPVNLDSHTITQRTPSDNGLTSLWTSVECGDTTFQLSIDSTAAGVYGNEFLHFPASALALSMASRPQIFESSEVQRMPDLQSTAPFCNSLSECLDAMESSLYTYVQLLGDQASETL